MQRISLMMRIRNVAFILALVCITFISGYELGLKGVGRKYLQTSSPQVVSTSQPSSIKADFSLFWDVWDRVSRLYVDKGKLDAQKMVYGAISGMVSSLGDPYTVFLPPDQNKDAKDDLGGIFEGIGAQLGIEEKKIVVVAPLKDSPAEKAGIKTGDWIVKVDNQLTGNWTLPEAISKIRGPKKSKVVLTVIHKNASNSADISVERDEIKVSSVEWEVKKFKNENGIYKSITKDEICNDCAEAIYLRLGRFGDQTSDEWVKAIDEIKPILAKGIVKGIIFDLRNNPGGYLSGSVFIASEFLKDGVVVMQESASGAQQKYMVNRKGDLYTQPVVVLVNKGSASASEIVAGALHDRGRAKLVGETTFGKGTIQDAQELPGGTGLHITTAKWLLPSGAWINGKGIEPDVTVLLDEARPTVDTQLDGAFATLVK